MRKYNLIAIDLIKNTHQICIFDKHDNIISNKPFRADALAKFLAKQKPSLVAFEACGGSHHYVRSARSLGHQKHPYGTARPIIKLIDHQPRSSKAVFY